MVHVAIIDTGVDSKHRCFAGAKFSGIFITKKNNKIVISDDFTDDTGHGTGVASIIYQHNKDICFHIIRLFCKKQYVADEEMLVYALNYVNDNIKCDILNLSLGYVQCNNKDKLYELCSDIRAKGTFIISAFDNRCSLSYPAVFDNVIGVASSDKKLKNYEFEYVEQSEINILGKGDQQRVAWKDNCYITIDGSSFACAHITGIVSNILKDNPELDMRELLQILKGNSVHVYEGKEKKEQYNLFNLKHKKVVAFPFNKEMHALVRYSDLLCAELVDVYDIKYSLRVGVNTNTLLNATCPVNYRIKNIDNLNFESFDIFVLGHTDELMAIVDQKSYIRKLIILLIRHKKKIYSFDNLEYLHLEQELSDAYNYIFTPYVTENDLPVNRFGYMSSISIPTLLVCGTSSKQGKFSLQLELRKRFLERKIKLGQIGTEPSSYLFDMDDCYHYGYNHSNTLEGRNTVQYINESIRKISEKGKEIVISGCQSAMLVREENYLYSYPMEQYSYLLAFQPDAIVLCINYYDELNFIGRTINYLEGAVECKVVAIVVFPGVYKSSLSGNITSDVENNILIDKINEVNKEFGIDVFSLGVKNSMDSLTDLVIDYFTE